ncbi:MAG: DUF4097 domain-containing protein [Lachnospiraceae bacterium]|nr:DUF4097 domain-containing protein [Lachnospiraceae bacterium]
MNKTVKIILIAAAIMLAAGAAITALGFAFGGKGAMSLRFGNGHSGVSTEISEETMDIDEFDSLTIDVSSVDVSIVKGDKFSLRYKTRKGEEPEVEQSGRSLSVKEPSKANFVIFDFGFADDLDTYTITVPEGSKEIEAKLKSSSGDLLISGVKISGEVKSSSGDLLFENVEGAGLTVTASSGSLSMNGLESSDLAITTSSGDINGDKVKADKISISTSSGETNFLRLSAGSMTCAASSGDINIFDSELKELSCDTSSGELEIGLNGDSSTYSYDISSSSGDIAVNKTVTEKSFVSEGSGDGNIKIKTSSGDINVQIGK